MKRFLAPLIGLIAFGIAIAGAQAACYDDRTATILSAMATLDPENPAHFTKSGKPKVAAVEVTAGLDTNAKERDAVWKEFPAWHAAKRAEDDRAQAAADIQARSRRCPGAERSHPRIARQHERRAGPIPKRGEGGAERVRQDESRAQSHSGEVPSRLGRGATLRIAR